MTPKAIKGLRQRLHLTQEVFARILGVSFATVNRWENGKTVPTGDYARVLDTLGQLTIRGAPGPTIDWRKVGAFSAMAAMAGFSPLLTLGAALAPMLIASLPSWSGIPLGKAFPESSEPRPQAGKSADSKRLVQKFARSTVRKPRAKAPPPRPKESPRTSTQRTGG
ncbi:MAG: helix-turn-helix domain-containing protein [Candidatus Binatia bacterium]